MIVAETADRYRFVTQPDHADLAGQFAEAWGSDTFDRPVPCEPVLTAAYAHDTGWLAYDRHPRLDDDGAPVDFREMPAGPWIDLYDDGIDAVVEVDPYAGLLVSMHGAGLRNRRYGLSPNWPATPPEYETFVEREEDRQRDILDDLLARDGPVSEADATVLASLHESGRVADAPAAESRLWTNYKLLQAWDTLSLAFCVTHSPPGYGEVGQVPVDGTTDTTLSIEATGDGEYRVDPYPFDEAPLQAAVPARTVRKDAFDDGDDLATAYFAAGRETLELTLRPADD